MTGDKSAGLVLIRTLSTIRDKGMLTGKKGARSRFPLTLKPTTQRPTTTNQLTRVCFQCSSVQYLNINIAFHPLQRHRFYNSLVVVCYVTEARTRSQYVARVLDRGRAKLLLERTNRYKGRRCRCAYRSFTSSHTPTHAYTYTRSH